MLSTKRKAKLRKMLLYQEYRLFCLKRELGITEEKEMADKKKLFRVIFKTSDGDHLEWQIEADLIQLAANGDLMLVNGKATVAAFRTWCSVCEYTIKEQ